MNMRIYYLTCLCLYIYLGFEETDKGPSAGYYKCLHFSFTIIEGLRTNPKLTSHNVSIVEKSKLGISQNQSFLYCLSLFMKKTIVLAFMLIWVLLFYVFLMVLSPSIINPCMCRQSRVTVIKFSICLSVPKSS